jgi:hypothetical protein
MPKKAKPTTGVASKAAAKIHKTPYAQLTLDWSFKRVFATPGHEHLLVRLITSFLDGHLDAPIKTVRVLNTTYTAKTKKLRSAVFDLHCEDELGNYFIVEIFDTMGHSTPRKGYSPWRQNYYRTPVSLFQDCGTLKSAA